MEADRSIARRSLLLGALAAGLGLPACGGGSTPGSPTSRAVRSTGASPRASAPLAVACLGCGGHGRALLKRLQADDRVRVRMVCDPDAARAAAAARAVERSGAIRPMVVTDLRRTLDDLSIDAVVVAAPHHWHALAAVWAMRAGKHVYLEKPATHSLGEGSVLLEEWQASGRVLEVGTQRRSHPGLQEAIAAVHDGEIGPVDHARSYSWRRRPPIGPVVRGTWPSTVDADLWFGPRPVARPTRERFHYDWHWFVDFGNGGLGNNGVHRLDVARWGLGLAGQPDRILSLGGRRGPKDAGETPNTALTVVAFGDRTVAHDLRGLPTRPIPRLDPGMRSTDEVAFVGGEASIVVDRVGGRLVAPGGRVVARYGEGAEEVDPIARHLRRWVSACLAEDPSAVAVGPAEGVAAADMCHAPAEADRAVRAEADRAVRAGDHRPAPAPWQPDQVIADVVRMCGSAMRRPVSSFLTHVDRTAVVAYTGIRSAHEVRAGAREFEYRPGYRLL